MTALQIRYGSTSEMVEMDGYALPSEFTAEFDLGDSGRLTAGYRVRDHSLECETMNLSGMRNLMMITGKEIGSILSDQHERVVQLAAMPIRDGDDMITSMITHSIPSFSSSNSRRVTGESLGRVAEIVQENPKLPGERRDAQASQVAYTKIQNEFGVQPRTAQLWVKRAREAGHL